jgi:hypothetical protein
MTVDVVLPQNISGIERIYADPSKLVGTGYSIPGFTPGAVFFTSFGGVKRLK